MKELEQKLHSLEIEKERLEANIQYIQNDIEEKMLEGKNYTSIEMALSNEKEELRYVERKIEVITDAMNILEGVGI